MPKVAHVLETYERMLKMVEDVKVSDKKASEGTVAGEFKYRNSDYLGRDLISVDRDRDQLYITIGVANRNPDTGVAGGFYLVGTNGSSKNIKEAIAATGHLWC